MTPPAFFTPSGMPTVTSGNAAAISSFAADALEVGVDGASRQRMTLHFADECRVAASYRRS